MNLVGDQDFSYAFPKLIHPQGLKVKLQSIGIDKMEGAQMLWVESTQELKFYLDKSKVSEDTTLTYLLMYGDINELN